MNPAVILERLRELVAECDRRMAASSAAAPGLACPPLCGRCCRMPHIDVSVLECLPAAVAIVSGPQAAELSRRVRAAAADWPDRTTCPLFIARTATEGRCGMYAERPLLCRLYGAAVRTKGPSRPGASKRLVGCDQLQAQLAEQAGPAVAMAVRALNLAPDFEASLKELSRIAPALGTVRFPIAQALAQALSLVETGAWTCHDTGPDPAAVSGMEVLRD